MPKLAANLSYLWQELPYLDRFSAAADAGFQGVEVLFPYDVAVKETQRALLTTDLPMISLNAPPPNYAGGARGFAAIPGGQARFQQDLRRALRYCEALRVPTLHVMAGAAEGADARATLVENLRWAVGAIPNGLTLTIAPQAESVLPGSFLGSYDQTAALVAEVGHPSLGLQFDSFLAQRDGREAATVFEAHASMIRHVVLGDAPDRSAPGTGDVDFTALRAAIEARGYDGWISSSYVAPRPTENTLAWLAEWL
jgi:hydroxypyruvate isomerase